MSVPFAKIVYDAGAGSVTFQPTYPPVNKPGPHDGNSDHLSAQRGDSISLSGKKQTAWWRTDTFRVLQMENVPWDDLAGWNAFMQYAVKGGEFDYYPDATVSDFLTFTLEDTDWDPQKASYKLAKFKLNMRLAV